MKQKLVLIGSGMVGARFIERLLLEAPNQFDIRVFNKEPNGGYNRVMLSPVLAGEKQLPEIMTHDHDWFEERDVHLHTSTEIVAVDQQNKAVTTDLGAVYSYDKLIIATGSNPFILPIPGADLSGVVAFRDIRDVNLMIKSTNSKQKAVVIGGGLLGLEAANGLIKRGMEVTVVHRGDVLMNVQMDSVSGELLQKSLEANGMKFAMSSQTSEIIGDEYVTAVKMADGRVLDADLVVMAVGIRPNIGVAQKLGLEVNRGIVVNDQLETSAEDIYALGECVEHRQMLYGLVAPLYEQAQVLAETLAGKESGYQGSFISTKLKVTGISLFSAGDFNDSEESESLIYKDLTQNIYRKIVLKDNKIQGAIMFGDVSGSNWIFDNLVAQNDMSKYRDTLVFGEGFQPSTASLSPKQEKKESRSMSKQKIVVIGNGMVGHNFIEKLVASEGYDNFEVHTFCEEPRVAYDRVYLSSYFSGKTAEDLSLVKPGFYEENGVEIYMNDKAVDIDKAAKTVTSEAGITIEYDKLIMATGSFPFVPPIDGNDRDGCLVYRTIEDLDAMKEVAARGKVGVVVGGGLLGLEAAKALVDLGLETHVVEFAPRLMPVQLDDGGAALLKRKIENLGVTVHTSKATTLITDGENCMNKMVFADGEELETDMVLFSAGIRPRDDLAKSSGLELGPRGGIQIDDQCKTSDADVFAIGECALHDGMIYGLVAPGYAMAQVVVNQLNAEPAQFDGADMSTKLKLMGVDVASIGDPHGTDENALSYVYENGPEEIYKKIVVTPDGKKLLGAVLVGDAEDFGNLLQIMLNDMDLPEHPDALILPNRDGSGADLFGPDALPETAQLCSCYDVSKGDIVNAVEGGCCTMADVKATTEAGTGCGGCVQLVTNVLNSELEKRGVEVNTDICEHFGHTRQELYHICKVGEIKDFDTLITKHGKGCGCEVCKQAAGSIFASLWNAYAMADDQIPLQDTNDNYLGNTQKDGTYSVIPRVPGGEITPEKLIVLGEVAKKYKLYTKVNGGQRIVLFGAQMNDLPSIWKELIDAGFESGQAYAKALRTVKSCVGSTWCRFGLDDSVTMAIEMENRYKGVRSPHKMKMGVSGCTRECAEAQAKDIGLISTENGWNLFVCGNGGMKPRHADLFATDLTKEEVFKYVDRLLMFYIKTANRLERTATWMDNMEGGLAYLQDVVINDSLGLGEELEAQMEALHNTYKCDWKTAIENPEFTKRFRSFVNVDTPAEQLFVQERGQIRPATEDEKLAGIAVEIKQIA